MAFTPRSRLLAAFAGETVDRPPVWLMRQAGRYLEGYRAVRAQHGFWEVCHRPELSTKVALEPLARFPLDAAIVFSDILVIPEALGLGVTFEKGEGPQLARTLRSREELEAWDTRDIPDRLRFLPAAVAHLREAIGEDRGLMGFAGAPFTLFAYSVEGGGSDDFRHARTILLEDPELAHRAMAILADAAGQLLVDQAEAGADAVQLFDTWGGLLDAKTYETFAVPALRRITDRLNAKGVPSLLFVRGGHHLLPVLGQVGATGYSIDWRTPIAAATEALPGAGHQPSEPP